MAKEILTPKQKRFCEEYLIDLNGTQAAIRAGYSKKTANEQSAQNLAKLSIKEYIQEKQKELSNSTKISAEWVLNRFLAISNRCMKPELKMVREGKEWVAAVDENGDLVYEFDSSGANRATEMIGKHLGFFKEDNNQSATIIKVQRD